MDTTKLATGLGLLLLFLGFASCGGGGGGGGSGDKDFGFEGTGFGFSEIFGNTTGSGTSNEFPMLDGVNIPVILYFNDDIDPASVNHNSIQVRTITVPDGDDPDNLVHWGGGHGATVEFVVNKSTLYIVPITSFTPEGNPDFGFLDHAAYEIKFTLSPDQNVVKSTSGKKVSIPKGKPVAFITTDTIYDLYTNPEWPEPKFYLIDNGGEVLVKEGEIPEIGIQDLPESGPMFRIRYSEPVLLAWGSIYLINSTDHTSDALHVVYYDQYGVPLSIPGAWLFVKNSVDPYETYLEFWPHNELQSLPELNQGEYLHLIADGTVSDLAGNTKGLCNNDPYGIHDERLFQIVGSPDLDPIEEDFINSHYEDTSATSANWDAEGNEGYLTLGGGGGDGSDGKFFPPDDYPQDVNLGVVVDGSNNIVYLPTSWEIFPGNVWEPYTYNFSYFKVPSGWTIKPKSLPDAAKVGDAFPALNILVTGNVEIDGTVEVNGGQGGSDDISSGPDGTTGGVCYAGGYMGGQGGCVPSDSDPETLDLEWDFGGVFSSPTDPDLEGVSGLSTEIGDYYLVDTNVDFSTIETFIVNQMLQPNVGMGDGNDVFVTNHNTFYIEKVDDVDPNKIWVYSDTEHALYRGMLTDQSKNPGFPPPPIVKAGDPYLVGYLRGSDGEDGTVFDPGGKGGDPLSVAQTILTLAAAGRGGGGGGSEAGVAGATYWDASISMGGNSFDETVGGPGGDPVVLTGTVVSVTPPVQLQIDADLSSWAPDGLVDYRVNPNYDDADPNTTNDWIFRITGNTADTLTVEELKNGHDLVTDVVGADIGTLFIIYPPESMGGAGGGGSGIELTGTYKTTFQPPFQLPRWLHGAGGGSGGGKIMIESAHTIKVSSTGKVLANGGNGGVLTGSQVTLPSGGGGSGGSIILRSKEDIQVAYDGLISAAGGESDDVDDDPNDPSNNIADGIGGDGIVRLENGANDLLVSDFTDDVHGAWTKTVPPVEERDLGLFLPSSNECLGQSLFYSAGLIVPVYDSITVYYEMDVDGFTYTDLVFKLDGDVLDPSSDYDDPPFTGDSGQGYDSLLFNGADADPETGNVDMNTIDENYVAWRDFNDNNHSFVRFKIKMLTTKDGNQGKYTNLKIDKVVIVVSQ